MTTKHRRSPLSLLAALALVASLAVQASADGPLSSPTTFDLPSKTHDVEVVGTLAYVATEAGLSILNVTTPSSPSLVGATTPSTANRANAVAVSGSWAYMAGPSAGLIVVNVANPAAPVVRAKKAVSGGLWDVAVHPTDPVVYGVSLYGEMYVFDVSSPLAPTVVKVIGLPAWASAGGDAVNLQRLRDGVTSGNGRITGVSVAGPNHLFAVEWAYGRLYYFDISTPLAPEFAGTHYAPYLLKAFADLSRDVVFMVSGYGSLSGLYSVPISILSPFASTRYNACSQCGYLKSLFAIDMGDLVIASDRYVAYGGGKGNGEFHVVDVTVPTAMADVASTTIGPHAVAMAHGMGMAVRGDYVLVAAGNLGIKIYHYPGLTP